MKCGFEIMAKRKLFAVFMGLLLLFSSIFYFRGSFFLSMWPSRSSGEQFDIEDKSKTWRTGRKGCNGGEYIQFEAHQLPSKRAHRIMCMVMTSWGHLQSRGRLVWDGWAKDCDKTIFLADREHPDFPIFVTKLNGADARRHLTEKSIQGWQHVHDEYLDEMDFVLKADDDTHVFMNNLREFLSQQSPDVPNYYGHLTCEPNNGTLFHSGGAGYVLSRAAVRVLVRQVHLTPDCKPRTSGAIDDFLDGLCLKMAGVLPTETWDEKNRERFVPGRAIKGWLPENQPTWQPSHQWFFSKQYQKGWPDCCSKDLITVHRITNKQEKEELLKLVRNTFGDRFFKQTATSTYPEEPVPKMALRKLTF